MYQSVSVLKNLRSSDGRVVVPFLTEEQSERFDLNVSENNTR